MLRKSPCMDFCRRIFNTSLFCHSQYFNEETQSSKSNVQSYIEGSFYKQNKKFHAYLPRLKLLIFCAKSLLFDNHRSLCTPCRTIRCSIHSFISSNSNIIFLFAYQTRERLRYSFIGFHCNTFGICRCK